MADTAIGVERYGVGKPPESTLLTAGVPMVTVGVKNTSRTVFDTKLLSKRVSFTGLRQEVASETGAYFVERRNGMRVINIQEGGEGQ
ncbi:MAG: hypothetical protein M3Y42_07075 [Actinomycetota bacterium]|nr:hypothetical protein [Actinomycetota bacterium]MDQ2956708.1 hypothetical protein [Actinomycetota bacterium]